MHRLDPRVKLIIICISSILVLTLKIHAVFVMAIALCIAFYISRISFACVVQAVRPLLFFICLIFAVHMFSRQGEALIVLPGTGFLISKSGLEEASSVALRFLCLIAAAVKLTMTTTPSQLTAALKYLLQPLRRLRLPVDDLAVMTMVALRLMPVLLGEKERIETAQKARAYDVKKMKWKKRLAAFVALTTAVVISVFRRADELAMAMEARGYHRGIRTSHVELAMGNADYAAIIVFFAVSAVLIGLNTYM